MNNFGFDKNTELLPWICKAGRGKEIQGLVSTKVSKTVEMKSGWRRLNLFLPPTAKKIDRQAGIKRDGNGSNINAKVFLFSNKDLKMDYLTYNLYRVIWRFGLFGEESKNKGEHFGKFTSWHRPSHHLSGYVLFNYDWLLFLKRGTEMQSAQQTEWEWMIQASVTDNTHRHNPTTPKHHLQKIMSFAFTTIAVRQQCKIM